MTLFVRLCIYFDFSNKKKGLHRNVSETEVSCILVVIIVLTPSRFYSVRRGTGPERRVGRAGVSDRVLDGSVLLLSLGHVDLIRLQPSSVKIPLPLPPPLVFMYDYCKNTTIR